MDEHKAVTIEGRRLAMFPRLNQIRVETSEMISEVLTPEEPTFMGFTQHELCERMDAFLTSEIARKRGR